jgi:hypothetical protein
LSNKDKLRIWKRERFYRTAFWIAVIVFLLWIIADKTGSEGVGYFMN